jgi:ABC-type glycerol-3-phosphate transport system permease component
VIVVAIFQEMLGNSGLLDDWLRSNGHPTLAIIGNASLFKALLTSQVIWKDSGWATILFLAALSQIDAALYEAASVDGASRWRMMWHVTLPGLRSIIILLFILRLGNILSVGFEQILLQQGQVGLGTSEVLDTYVYHNGVLEGQWGVAAAVGLVQRPGRRSPRPRREQGRAPLRRRRAIPVMSRARTANAPSGVPTPPVPMRAAKGVVLTVACALVLVPFIGVISTSLATEKQVTESGGFVLIPNQITFGAYQAVLAGGVVTRAFVISVLVTVVGTAISLFSTTTLAYALSRRGSFGHRPLLPLSKAAIAVIGLFYAVSYWNAFFNALLYINDTSKWPLQLILRTYVVNNSELGASQLGGNEALPPQ